MIFNPEICHKCGHHEVKREITSTIDGHLVCEESYNCVKCGAVVAYWAYGSWDDPLPYMETKWQRFKYLFLGKY